MTIENAERHGKVCRTRESGTRRNQKKVVPDFSSRRIGIAPDRRGTMAVKGILEVQRHFFAVENTLDPAIRK